MPDIHVFAVTDPMGNSDLLLLSWEANPGFVLALALVHVGVSIVATWIAFSLLPRTHRGPTVHGPLFFFMFSLMVPVFGALGIIALALISRRFALPYVPEVYRVVDLPHFSEGRKRIRHNYGPGGIRARLLNERLPIELRMRTLLAAQDMPGRLSSPIMYELLSDSADDLRLLASGLLSKKQRSIHDNIQRRMEKLAEATDDAERATHHWELAELYWELAYQALVLGELQRHALSQARRYALEAVRVLPQDGALWALLGRVLLREQQPDKAEEAFARAIKLGYPAARLIPYQAEIAFTRRNFQELRALLAQVQPAERTAAIDPLIRYWVGEASQ